MVKQMMTRVLSVLSMVGIFLLLPTAAYAHGEEALQYGSFLGGLMHPVLGPDHLLAMISVGIVSAQIGGRAIWTVPATFVLVMAVGGVLGMIGITLSFIELGIAMSVLVLGIVIAADKRLPILLAMLAVAVFAIFHGYAHGAEMPVAARPMLYGLGFMTGTAAIHLLGVGIGELSRQYEQKSKPVLRLTGSAIAVVGLLFIVGVF